METSFFKNRKIPNPGSKKYPIIAAQLEAKVLEYNEDNTDVMSGTLPAFRRTNARKAAEIQSLVLSYRDTEERTAKLIGRHNDLQMIEDEISAIIENDTIQKISDKVDFLSESIVTIRQDLDAFDRKLNDASAEVIIYVISSLCNVFSQICYLLELVPMEHIDRKSRSNLKLQIYLIYSIEYSSSHKDIFEILKQLSFDRCKSF